MMPFITSQFMPRTPGDRPEVVPAGSNNLAFLGQFAEVPDDVVFTVEYSVRSALMAVHELFDAEGDVPPVSNQYRAACFATRSGPRTAEGVDGGTGADIPAL